MMNLKRDIFEKSSVLTLAFVLISSMGWAQLEIVSPVKFLALGDSYTIGESVSASERWPAQLVDSLTRRGLICEEPRIIATTGWRTDDLKAAIQSQHPSNTYNLVSLLIGVNNYYQGRSITEYATQFEELLNMAITFAQGNPKHVMVLSIPDYGYTPFGKNQQAVISQGMDNFNSVNASITAQYHVPYFNITPVSRQGLAEPDLVASDGLHPSGKQYARWVHIIMTGSTFGKDSTVTAIERPEESTSSYPNPFVSTINFTGLGSDQSIIHIEIIDPLGRPFLKTDKEIIEGKLSITLPNTPPGTYFYRLSLIGGKVFWGKILKTGTGY